jgi:hypothetical protein
LSVADQDTEALDILRRLEPTLVRVEQRLGRLEDRIVNHGERLVRIEATLPHLATAAELARRPARTELWAMLAVMLSLFAVVLGALPYVWKHWPP